MCRIVWSWDATTVFSWSNNLLIVMIHHLFYKNKVLQSHVFKSLHLRTWSQQIVDIFACNNVIIQIVSSFYSFDHPLIAALVQRLQTMHRIPEDTKKERQKLFRLVWHLLNVTAPGLSGTNSWASCISLLTLPSPWVTLLRSVHNNCSV